MLSSVSGMFVRNRFPKLSQATALSQQLLPRPEPAFVHFRPPFELRLAVAGLTVMNAWSGFRGLIATVASASSPRSLVTLTFSDWESVIAFPPFSAALTPTAIARANMKPSRAMRATFTGSRECCRMPTQGVKRQGWYARRDGVEASGLRARVRRGRSRRGSRGGREQHGRSCDAHLAC